MARAMEENFEKNKKFMSEIQVIQVRASPTGVI